MNKKGTETVRWLIQVQMDKLYTVQTVTTDRQKTINRQLEKLQLRLKNDNGFCTVVAIGIYFSV